MRFLSGSVRRGAAVNNVMSGTPLSGVQPTGTTFATSRAIPAISDERTSPYVSRVPREQMRYLYSYGAQDRSNYFPMVATGQVNSSAAQTQQSNMFNASFNDSLYLGVYPQNTGISFKVEHTPNSLRRGDGPQMNAQPRQTNSIFTRRAFNTAPSLPAKPTVA